MYSETRGNSGRLHTKMVLVFLLSLKWAKPHLNARQESFVLASIFPNGVKRNHCVREHILTRTCDGEDAADW